MEENAELAQLDAARFLVQAPKASAIVKDVASSGVLQADHIPQERAFAGAALTHDDEDRAAFDPGIDVAHDHIGAVGHGQVLELDLDLVRVHVPGSNMQCIREHGKNAVGSNDGGNPRHDRAGSGLAHGRSRVTTLHAAQTAGVGDQEAKEGALEDAEEEAPKFNSVDRAA